jgi:hypothetical protein
MGIKQFLGLIFILATCQLHSFAQDDASLQLHYLKGKSALERTEYAEALLYLKPITGRADLPVHPYAIYFYCLALHGTGKPAEAISLMALSEKQYSQHPILSDLRAKRLEWLLGAQRFSEAWTLWGTAPKGSKEETQFNLMMTAAIELATTDSLEAWAREGRMPAALVLGNRLWAESTPESRAKAKDWYQKFQIPWPKEWAKPTKKTNGKAWSIALLLPFQVDHVDYNRKSLTNSYVYDYYFGFKKGIDSLNKSGFNFKLNVVDIGKDQATFQKLLSDGSLLSTDLVVGPLLTQQSHLLSNYAEEKELTMINPINDQASISQGKKYVFSTEPVREQLAMQVARYAISQTIADTALIIYGETEKDSLLALQYVQALKTFPEAYCAGTFKVTRYNYMHLYERLSVHQLDSLKHLFVSVTDPTLEAAVMSALDQNLNMTEVYASYEWLDNNLISFDQFERKYFRFFHPAYVNYQHPLSLRFSRSYTESMGVVPSIYAYKGFEHSLLFGKLLKQHEGKLAEHLRSGNYIRGVLMSGFRNSSSGGNSCVPILKFNQQEIQLANEALLKE